MAYPYTGTNLDAATRTGLSTQIIIKIDGVAVGAMQTLTAAQRRQNKRVHEIGTDGVIEITPEQAASVTLDVNRIVFNKKSLPEAMGRAFANIHAQRVPFDIYVYDFSGVNQAATDSSFDVADNMAGVKTTVYEQCWFNSLSVTYSAENYIISQTANLDVTSVKTYLDGNPLTSASLISDYSDLDGGGNNVAAAVERVADIGRRGSMDARGLISTQGLF
jgi:hypothetical protein